MDGAPIAVFATHAGGRRAADSQNESALQVLMHCALSRLRARVTSDRLYSEWGKANKSLEINDLYKMSEKTNPTRVSLSFSSDYL